MAKNRKHPKQNKFPNKRSKKPKGTDAPKQIPNSNFCWRVSDVDMDGEWGWGHPTTSILLKTIIPKLHEFESMTWAEIEGKENHFIACDCICKKAQSRLEKLEKMDVEEVFSLRLSSKQRIFGIRIGTTLNLLWWDPKHEICPSKKKHT